MKIIFDSNVYISLLLFPSRLTEKLSCIILKNELICPDIIVDEVLCTLLKKIKKFANGKILETTLLDDFWNLFIELKGSIFLYSLEFNKIEAKIRDIYDKQILQTAIVTNCDVFVTGDKDFKDVRNVNFKILTISEFVNLYNPEN